MSNTLSTLLFSPPIDLQVEMKSRNVWHKAKKQKKKNKKKTNNNKKNQNTVVNITQRD